MEYNIDRNDIPPPIKDYPEAILLYIKYEMYACERLK